MSKNFSKMYDFENILLVESFLNCIKKINISRTFIKKQINVIDLSVLL